MKLVIKSLFLSSLIFAGMSADVKDKNQEQETKDSNSRIMIEAMDKALEKIKEENKKNKTTWDDLEERLHPTFHPEEFENYKKLWEARNRERAIKNNKKHSRFKTFTKAQQEQLIEASFKSYQECGVVRSLESPEIKLNGGSWTGPSVIESVKNKEVLLAYIKKAREKCKKADEELYQLIEVLFP